MRYRTLVLLAWLSIGFGLIYSKFSADTMAKGLVILGVNGSKSLEIIIGLLAAVQFLGNVLGIQPKADSKRILFLNENSPRLPRGFYYYLTRIMMLVAFLTGALATALPLHALLKNYLYVDIPLIVLIGLSNSIYFILLSKQDVDNSIQRLLTKDAAIFSLLKKSKCLFTQAGFKIMVTLVYKGAMYAYIGDAFFRQVLGIATQPISMTVKIICGVAMVGVTLLTRGFPTFDNYYLDSQSITDQDRKIYSKKMSLYEKLLIAIKILPLSLFRCGYGYVCGCFLGFIAGLIISLLLFIHSYAADYRNTMYHRILASRKPTFINLQEKNDPYIRNDNKWCQAISIFINIITQCAWALCSIAFLNGVLAGILPKNEINILAVSIGAELGYTNYWYMAPKIQSSVVIVMNSGIDFLYKYVLKVRKLMSLEIPKDETINDKI